MFMTGVLCTVCGAQVYLLQAVLLHYIVKIHANSHWNLNSLTLSIEPKHVY